MSVYTIDHNIGDGHDYAVEPLEGDFDNVYPTGFDFHSVTKSARLEDGTRIKKAAGYQGLPVDMTGLPKKIRFVEDRRELLDLHKTWGHFFVSHKLRNLIEGLEPDTHQFASVELVWENNIHSTNYYWFNPCNRIDSIDRKYSTAGFNEKTGKWKYEGGSFTINLGQVSGSHIWIDSRASFNSVWVSDQFKQAAVDANITGIGFREFNTV